MRRLRTFQDWTRLWLAFAGVSLSVISAAGQVPDLHRGQSPDLPNQLPSEIGHKLSDRLPEKPSLPAAFSFPVQRMGYSAPGLFYLGRHNRLVSLDFIGEDRLLFTFQVPGLMERQGDSRPDGDERQIRAVVVTLPDGKVQSEGRWTLHDRAPYLWMLKDGQFLLRDEDGIREGDATLQLKPYLHFPGRVLWLELNPAQQLMSVSFLAPPSKPKGVQAGASDAAKADIVKTGNQTRTQRDPSELKPDLVVRTLNRETGKVVAESRVGLAVPQEAGSDGYAAVEEGMLTGLLKNALLPFNSDGFIAAPGEDTNKWLLAFRPFDGDEKSLESVSSACRPISEFVSEREFLMTACDIFDGWDVVALSASGERLWGVRMSDHEVWPQLASSQGGMRLARETVAVEHPVPGGQTRLVDPKNLKGQIVRVFDAANGKVVLETTANPILDGGGNVAISPSGHRVAILNNGEIQIFELPTPAAFRRHIP